MKLTCGFNRDPHTIICPADKLIRKAGPQSE
jgi:hypothetical protein